MGKETQQVSTPT